jgi:hypothetical protein
MDLPFYFIIAVQSLRGEKLVRRGDMHIGSHISRLIRLRKPPRAIKSNDNFTISHQHSTVGGLICLFF